MVETTPTPKSAKLSPFAVPAFVAPPSFWNEFFTKPPSARLSAAMCQRRTIQSSARQKELTAAFQFARSILCSAVWSAGTGERPEGVECVDHVGLLEGLLWGDEERGPPGEEDPPGDLGGDSVSSFVNWIAM